MTKYSKPKRYLVKQLRRNERRMNTKKATKAFNIIAATIVFLVILQGVISTANSSKVITIENRANSPLGDGGTPKKAVEKSLTAEVSSKPSSMGTSVDKGVEEKIRDAFPEHPELMIAIAKAESGLNPYATNKNRNGSTDTGLFQINSIHGHDQLELTKVDKNIEVARQVYEKQGLGAWVAFTNNSYKKHL